MVEIQKCLFRKSMLDNPISLYAATRSNELHIHIVTSTNCPLLVLDSLLFMVHGSPVIWHCLSLQNQLLKIKRFKFLTTEICLQTFTYIDDVVESVFRVIYKTPQASINHNSSEKGHLKVGHHLNY